MKIKIIDFERILVHL